MRVHSESSSARRAAATARSMSAASPAATVAMTASLEGSRTSKVSPLCGVDPLAADEELVRLAQEGGVAGGEARKIVGEMRRAPADCICSWDRIGVPLPCNSNVGWPEYRQARRALPMSRWRGSDRYFSIRRHGTPSCGATPQSETDAGIRRHADRRSQARADRGRSSALSGRVARGGAPGLPRSGDLRGLQPGRSARPGGFGLRVRSDRARPQSAGRGGLLLPQAGAAGRQADADHRGFRAR